MGTRARSKPNRQAGSRTCWGTWTERIAPADLDVPGYRLHPLKGARKGLWSVTISGNWRIVFRLEDGDAFEVDLVDYH